MSRFSIREILLLTVVVALALGWWLHARRNASDLATLKQQAEDQAQMAALQELLRTQEVALLRTQLQSLQIPIPKAMPPVDAPPKFVPGLPDSKLGR